MAKKSAKKSAKKTASKSATRARKSAPRKAAKSAKKSARRPNAAFMRPVAPSPVLAEIVGPADEGERDVVDALGQAE